MKDFLINNPKVVFSSIEFSGAYLLNLGKFLLLATYAVEIRFEVHMVFFSFFRHLTIGLPKIGHLKIPTTQCTCASVPCKIRPGLNWLIMRLKIWPACRKCSAVNGSIFSCRPKPSPKWIKSGTNRKGKY